MVVNKHISRAKLIYGTKEQAPMHLKDMFGKWIYGYPVLNYWDNPRYAYDYLLTASDGTTYLGTVEIDASTLGRYTEIHDENKKPIFEGDLVRDSYSETDYFEGIVTFQNGRWEIVGNVGTHKEGASRTFSLYYANKLTLI